MELCLTNENKSVFSTKPLFLQRSTSLSHRCRLLNENETLAKKSRIKNSNISNT